MRKALALLVTMSLLVQSLVLPVSANTSIIGGGSGNTSTIGGGSSNTGNTSTIGGGSSNTGNTSTIGGGSTNTGNTSTIGGGSSNTGNTSTIGGGSSNTGNTSTIGGGSSNTGNTSTIGGGSTNTGNTSTIGGGSSNTGNTSSIGGGSSNTGSTGNVSIIGGGFVNSGENTSVIGGGSSNTGNTSVIGGGSSNTGNTSVIGGGSSNTGNTSVIGGGSSNTGNTSIIGGGSSNTGNTSIIGGGSSNTGGNTSVIGGGSGNTGSTTQTGRPTVTLLSATNILTNSATLLFNGVDPDLNDSLTYNVCVSNVTNNGSAVCATTTNEFFVATGLASQTQYSWTVTVSDAAGQGTTTNGPLSFTTLAQQPTDLPPTLTVTGVSTTDTSFTVTWEASNDNGTTGLMYDICYSTDRNSVTFNCPESVTGATFYTVSNLRAGTPYFVTVRAREGNYTVYASNGIFGATTTGTPSGTTNRLPVTTLSVASNVGQTSADFAWNGSNQDVGETFSYRFCLSTSLATLQDNCGASTSATTATRSNLTANTTYFWTVLTSDGTFSNVAANNGPMSFTTTTGTSNRAPTIVLLAPNNAETRTNQTNTLFWQGSDLDNDALNYSLYIKEVGQGTTVDRNDLLSANNRKLSLNPQTSYDYTVENPNAVRNIFWMVVAADAGTTTESQIRSFVYQPGGANQAPVVNLVSPANGSTQTAQASYQLQWTGTDATALVYDVYTLEVDATATVQTFTNADIAVAGNLRTSGTANTSYLLQNPTAGRRIFWTVRASDGQLSSFPAGGPFRFDISTSQQTGISLLTTTTNTSGTQTTNFAAGQTANLNLVVTNTSGSAQTINFPTAQQYRFRVVNTATNAIVRTSDFGQSFAQTPSSLTLAAGASQTFTFPWTQTDNNGVSVGAGQYRIEAELTTATVQTSTPVTVTVGGGQQGNVPPVFGTNFMPSNGSVFTTASPIQLSWSATDANNDTLSYQLYLMSQPVGQAVPTLATVQNATNLVALASNATSHTFTPVLGRQYFWVVTVADASTTVVAATMPFTFTVDQNAVANSAPVVAMTTPGAINTAAAVNLTTAGATTFAWTGSDADAADVVNLRYNLYVMEVALSDTTVYTPAQIAVAANLRTPNTAASSASFTTTDQRKYWWTVTVTDGRVPAPIMAVNSPFTFTVNSNVQTPANLVWNVLTTNAAASTTQQNTFAANENVFTTLSVQNTGGTAQTITFNGTNWFTQTVTSVTSGQVVSTQNVAGNGTTTLTLNPGQTYTFPAVQWNGTDSNGVRLNGNFNVGGTVNALNYSPVVTPRQITLFGATAQNNAPVFTSFVPSNGSNFVTAAPVQLSWTASDADNDALSYQLYLVSQAIGQTAPTLAQTMVAANQITLAANATTHTFTPVLGQQYFWAVTVTDGRVTTPVVGGTMPFTFTVNAAAPANAGPTVTLTSPGIAAAGTPVNLLTAGNTVFSWAGADADAADVANLRYRLFVLEVPLSDNTVYTSAQVAQAQNVRGTYNHPQQSVTFTTTDQRKYWWTMDVTDQRVAMPVQAFNGPFTFTVNTTAQAQNLVWDLQVVSSPTATTAQTSFDQNQVAYLRTSVRNTGTTAQTLTFPSNNLVTLTIRDAANAVIFTQNVVGTSNTMTIPAGGSLDLPVVAWNGANSATGGRSNGTYTVSAALLATNGTATFPTRTVTLTTTQTGGGGGGGGGGGVVYAGGPGGGGSNVDIASPLNLPVTDMGARTWYGPVRFEPSNGEVKIDLTHIDNATQYCAKWQKDTVVTTTNGQRFLGTYSPIQRFDITNVDGAIRGRLPSDARALYNSFLQYGNLGEYYSKSVTICGMLPEDIRKKTTDASKIAILGYDPQTMQWVRLGGLANIANGRDFSVTIGKSMMIGFFEVGGSVIPGGNNGNTNNGDPREDDSFCRNFGSPFTDTDNHWSEYYVCRLYRMGVVTGYMEGVLKGLYGPDRSITRAELTKILVQMYGYDTTTVNPRTSFRDVSGDEWFAPYVAVAKEKGIVTGYEDGYFRPFRNINRAEALKIILLSAGLANSGTVDAEQLREMADSDFFAGFLDIPEDQWFSGYVAIGKRLGIISGKDGLFRAGDEMTRGEMAKVAFFVLELTNKN